MARVDHDVPFWHAEAPPPTSMADYGAGPDRASKPALDPEPEALSASAMTAEEHEAFQDAIEQTTADDEQSGNALTITGRSDLPASKPNWKDGLILNDDRGPRIILANAIHVLRHHPEMSGVFGFDEFSRRLVFLKAPPWNLRAQVRGETDLPVTDNDVVLATDW